MAFGAQRACSEGDMGRHSGFTQKSDCRLMTRGPLGLPCGEAGGGDADSEAGERPRKGPRRNLKMEAWLGEAGLGRARAHARAVCAWPARVHCGWLSLLPAQGLGLIRRDHGCPLERVAIQLGCLLPGPPTRVGAPALRAPGQAPQTPPDRKTGRRRFVTFTDGVPGSSCQPKGDSLH